MWDLSSPTRDWTRVCCIGRWTLNHWTTREVLFCSSFLKSHYSFISASLCCLFHLIIDIHHKAYKYSVCKTLVSNGFVLAHNAPINISCINLGLLFRLLQWVYCIYYVPETVLSAFNILVTSIERGLWDFRNPKCFSVLHEYWQMCAHSLKLQMIFKHQTFWGLVFDLWEIEIPSLIFSLLQSSIY